MPKQPKYGQVTVTSSLGSSELLLALSSAFFWSAFNFMEKGSNVTWTWASIGTSNFCHAFFIAQPADTSEPREAHFTFSFWLKLASWNEDAFAFVVSTKLFFFVRGKGKEKKIKKLSLVREGASGQTGDRREGRKEVFAYLFWCKDCTDLRAKVFQSSISMICLSLTKPFATFLFAHNETLGSAPDRGS